MSEISIRGANFLKVFSMMMVVGSLIYMYGYATDKLDVMNPEIESVTSLSKAHIFYAGLGLFVLFNLVMHVILHMYKSAQGFDPKSYLFKNKLHKARIIVWITYLLAGINIFLTTIITFVALAKINEATGTTPLIYFPIVGFCILIFIIIGLLVAIFRK